MVTEGLTHHNLIFLDVLPKDPEENHVYYLKDGTSHVYFEEGWVQFGESKFED